MARVEISIPVSDRGAAEMYALLCDTKRYPELTDAVLSVHVEKKNDSTSVSSWSVRFRNGIMTWTEVDTYYPERRTVEFTQVDGDFDHFTGTWSVEEDGTGCAVRFCAEFDLGMPTLAAMIDPLAQMALQENVTNIVAGLAVSPVEIR
jgi:ribosome-associated toxin RatA of RatAB toxin-antitoxin module